MIYLALKGSTVASWRMATLTVVKAATVHVWDSNLPWVQISNITWGQLEAWWLRLQDVCMPISWSSQHWLSDKGHKMYVRPGSNPRQGTINKLIYKWTILGFEPGRKNTRSGSNNGAQLPKMKAELESRAEQSRDWRYQAGSNVQAMGQFILHGFKSWTSHQSVMSLLRLLPWTSLTDLTQWLRL